MDPLSAVIALLRPHAAVSKPIAGRGDWGVRYSAYGQPGFAIVLDGRCWLEVEGAAPLELGRGDFVLLPTTPAFTLSSALGIACRPVEPSDAPIRHGEMEGDPDFRMLGGAFSLDAVNAPLLLPLLPRVVHLRQAEAGGLSRVIALLMEECAAERPGRDMVLERLLEVMLVECLRWQGFGGDTLSHGLLAGLRDPPVAAALRAMHAQVRGGWTVAGLAKLAGMSRSAFTVRFGATLGCSPMEYLLRWRMTLAQDALSRGGTSLDRLAEEVGYQSASAFSTAFRRRVGSAPGAFARSRRQATA